MSLNARSANLRGTARLGGNAGQIVSMLQQICNIESDLRLYGFWAKFWASLIRTV